MFSYYVWHLFDIFVFLIFILANKYWKWGSVGEWPDPCPYCPIVAPIGLSWPLWDYRGLSRTIVAPIGLFVLVPDPKSIIWYCFGGFRARDGFQWVCGHVLIENSLFGIRDGVGIHNSMLRVSKGCILFSGFVHAADPFQKFQECQTLFGTLLRLRHGFWPSIFL